MEDKIIRIATYPTAFEAELARQHLENWGIVSFIYDQYSTSLLPPMNPVIGYVKLNCRESDAARALELLKNISESHVPEEEDAATIEEPLKNSMGDDYVPVHSYCPKCESTDIYRKKFGTDINVVSAFFAQLTYRTGMIRIEHFCANCKHIWKDNSEDRVSG
jgi:hypothetical protein